MWSDRFLLLLLFLKQIFTGLCCLKHGSASYSSSGLPSVQNQRLFLKSAYAYTKALISTTWTLLAKQQLKQLKQAQTLQFHFATQPGFPNMNLDMHVPVVLKSAKKEVLWLTNVKMVPLRLGLTSNPLSTQCPLDWKKWRSETERKVGETGRKQGQIWE